MFGCVQALAAHRGLSDSTIEVVRLVSRTRPNFFRTTGCFLIRPSVFGVTSAKRFHNKPRFRFLASMLLGRVRLENVLFQTKKFHWHEMALSEHEFYEPKRFTISPGLTNTKVRILGPDPSESVEKSKKCFLITLPRFWTVFGSTGGSDDKKIA